MSYHHITDLYLENNNPPTCVCGEEMFAEDDHGRFRCICGKRKTVTIGESSSVTAVFGPRKFSFFGQ